MFSSHKHNWWFLYFRIDSDLNEACHLDELGDRLAQENERSYLRMVNRNHLYNSSNYSLSSLFRSLFLLTIMLYEKQPI